MALKKGVTDPRTGIRYDEHFLTPTQMRLNFKDLYDYARAYPRLTFVVAYTMHKRGDVRMGAAHSACEYSSNQLADFFGSCNTWEIPHNVVFEDYFDSLVKKIYRGHMKKYSMLS